MLLDLSFRIFFLNYLDIVLNIEKNYYQLILDHLHVLELCCYHPKNIKFRNH